MANKIPKTVEEQINLLLERGMLFKDFDSAPMLLPKKRTAFCVNLT